MFLKLIATLARQVNMDELSIYITRLSAGEVRIINRTLESLPKLPHSSLTLYKLFNLLLEKKGEDITQAELPEYWRISITNNNLKILKSRLKDKLLNILSSYINTTLEKTLDANEISKIEVLRILNKAHFIIKRFGYTKSARQLLDKAEIICRKHELYLMLIDVMHTRSSFEGFRRGPLYLSQQIKEHEGIASNFKAHYQAGTYYFQLILKNHFSFDGGSTSKRQFLDNAIRDLHTNYLSSGSKHVLYYTQLLELEQLELEKDYYLCLEKCNKLYQLLLENKILRTRSRLSSILVNIALYNIHLWKLDDALYYVRKGMVMTESLSNNYFLNNEIYFYTLFHQQKTKKAMEIAKMIYTKAPDSHGSFRKEKYHLFMVNAMFQAGEIKQALKESMLIRVITKDKSGWDTALRVFRIMCLVELGDIPLADRHIEDLMRQYYRIYKKDPISERFRLIIDLLNEYMKSEFRIKDLTQRGKKILKKLREKKKPHSWSAYSPELMPFHRWISKLS